jgi:protein TonB
VEYLPLVTVAAAYPAAAEAAGITGRCTVEFTVTASGTTDAVRAVDCRPVGVFESSAVVAARAFKYRPRLRAGQPVEARGVRNEFVFSLEH